MLINTSRGSLVYIDDLVACLKSGNIQETTIDAYNFEDKYY